MIGQVDVALRRDRPPEEYRRVLALVRDQSDHLRRIVEALLFLARADAEAGEPALDEFDLIRLGRRPDRPPGRAGRPRPARLGRRPPTARYRVRAHPALLAQVLDNLLDNARDHGRPGDARRGPGLAASPASVALAVEDRGRGIAPADLARVFEPFYRAPARGVRPGRGRPGPGRRPPDRPAPRGAPSTPRASPGRGADCAPLARGRRDRLGG